MTGCAHRRYSRGQDGDVVMSNPCGQPVRGFDVAFSLSQVDALLDDQVADVVPVVVPYCADHMPDAHPADPGYSWGAYAHGRVLLPAEGPRALGRPSI